MPSQRLAPALPPVSEGDEDTRSADSSVDTSARVMSGDKQQGIASAGAVDRGSSADSASSSGGRLGERDNGISLAQREESAGNQMCRDDSVRSSSGVSIKKAAAAQGEGSAANQLPRDDSVTSTPRSDTSECRMAYTPNELLQLCDAWAAPWEERRPRSQSASPALRPANSSSQPLDATASIKSSSQPLDLQRVLSCDRASVSSLGTPSPSPGRKNGGSGRISASPGRGSGSGGRTPVHPNASPRLLPPHSPMVLRQWEDLLFTSPSPLASLRRSRLVGGSGGGAGPSVEGGITLPESAVGSAEGGGNSGGDDARKDPALGNVRLPIHKFVRSSWPRYRLRRRSGLGVAMEGVAEVDEEEEEDDDDSSSPLPAVAGPPARSQSLAAATGATSFERAATVEISIPSETAIGSLQSHVPLARSGILSVSQRLAAADGSLGAGDSKPVSRRLSGQMRLGEGASRRSGTIDGCRADACDNVSRSGGSCDSSEGFGNMAEGMMAGGNAGTLLQLLTQVDKHGEYFRGDVEDPDLTSSMELDAELDDDPGFLARTDVARLVTDGTDTEYLPRLNKYFPFGAFTIFLMMQSLVAVVKSPTDQRAMTATSLFIGFAVSSLCPFIKRTGHTALVPRNSWKWPLAVRVGSTNLFIHADAQTLAHAVTKAIAFVPLGVCNDAAAKILFPGLQPYWLLLIQLSTFLLVASLTFFVHDHVPSIRTAARPIEPSLLPMAAEDAEGNDEDSHNHHHCHHCQHQTCHAFAATTCYHHHHQQHQQQQQHQSCRSYSHTHRCHGHSQASSNGYCNSSMTLGYSHEGMTPGYSQDMTPCYSQEMTPRYSQDMTPRYSQDMTPRYSQEMTPRYSQDMTPGSSFRGTPCESLRINGDVQPSDLQSKSTVDVRPSNVQSTTDVHSPEPHSTELQSLPQPPTPELLLLSTGPHPLAFEEPSKALFPKTPGTPCSGSSTPPASSSSTPFHTVVAYAGRTPPPCFFGAGSTPPLLRQVQYSPFSPATVASAGCTPPLLRQVQFSPSPAASAASTAPVAPAAPLETDEGVCGDGLVESGQRVLTEEGSECAGAFQEEGSECAGAFQEEEGSECVGASPGASSQASSSSSSSSSSRCGVLRLVCRNSSSGSGSRPSRNPSGKSETTTRAEQREETGNGKGHGEGNGGKGVMLEVCQSMIELPGGNCSVGVAERGEGEGGGGEREGMGARESSGVALATAVAAPTAAVEAPALAAAVAATPAAASAAAVAPAYRIPRLQMTEGASAVGSCSGGASNEDRSERGARAWRLISPPMVVKGGRTEKEGGK